MTKTRKANVEARARDYPPPRVADVLEGDSTGASFGRMERLVFLFVNLQLENCRVDFRQRG